MGKRTDNLAYASLDELLMELVERGVITRKQLGLAAMRSRDWAERLVRGETLPGWDELRLLIQNLPQDAVTEIFLLLLCNTRWNPPTLNDEAAELDVNNDGKINLDDALDSAINGSHAAQEALEKVRQAQANGDFSSLTVTDIAATIGRSWRANDAVVRILRRMLGPRLAREARIA